MDFQGHKKKKGGGCNCIIPDCQSNSYNKNGKSTGIHFFTIPRRSPKRDIWIKFIRSVDVSIRIPKNGRLCEKHFRPEDITKGGHWTVKAPPSIYIRDEEYAALLYRGMMNNNINKVNKEPNEMQNIADIKPTTLSTYKSVDCEQQPANPDHITIDRFKDENISPPEDMQLPVISNVVSLAENSSILNIDDKITQKDTNENLIITNDNSLSENQLNGKITIKCEPQEITAISSRENPINSEVTDLENYKYKSVITVLPSLGDTNPLGNQKSNAPDLCQYPAYDVTDIKLSCPICGKKLFDRIYYMRHMRIVHSPDHVYPCRHCDKKFDKRSMRTKHERVHTGEKPYKCEHCGKRFTWNGSYLRHKQQVHKGEKPYKCNICSKSFARNSYLEAHMASHTGQKNHKCPQCDKRFTDQPSVIRHRKIVHEKLIPYQCTVCGKCLTTNASLRYHTRTHTGERPFKCKLDRCELTFTTSSALARHKKTHTESREHVCNICEKAFSRKDYLRKHCIKHVKQERE